MLSLLKMALLWMAALALGEGVAAPKTPAPKAAPEAAPAKPATPAPVVAKIVPKVVIPPPKGSQVKPDDNFCYLCHTNKDQWDEKDPTSWKRYIPEAKLREDIHFQKGVSCHDCHGGTHDTDKVNVAHALEDGFRAKPEQVKESCAFCHKNEAVELRKSVHDKAGPKDERGLSTTLSCDACHGEVSHHLLPARDSRSPVFLDHQVVTCDSCHRKTREDYQNDLETYRESVHGHGLYRSGLLVTAACADCHGAHGIYRATDKRSTLHPENVAGTCGKCHRFIAERLAKSVHAHGNGAGSLADRAAPGGKMQRHPSCTSCHQKHEIAFPESTRFRLQLPNLCGNCHSQLSEHYAMSVHGELTELGYLPAAKCSDCHGAHDILAVADPASSLSADNRRATCAKCHVYATSNFLDFDPHADYRSRDRDPVLYWVYTFFMTLLISVFTVFGIHSVFWLVRGLIDVHRNGRPKHLRPGEAAYVRFAPGHQVAHLILLVSFLGLALTGLPLKYSHHEWGKALAFYMGGFGSTSLWHRFFAILTFGCFFVYVGRMLRRVLVGRPAGVSRIGVIFGPDSPMPNWRDAKDFGRMLRWFVGLGPKPTFERWAYWEKFDFWGACADIIIIGLTGLVLWFPNVFCSFLPGQILNISKVIHSTQALLATGFVFAIHFFSVHFRPDKFPADMSMLTGLVSEEEMQHERPEYLQRMVREGKLNQLRTTAPSRRRIWLAMLGGYVALAAGLALLAGMVVAGLSG